MSFSVLTSRISFPVSPKVFFDNIKKMKEQETISWKLIGRPDEIIILIMPVTERFFVFLVKADIKSRDIPPCPVNFCVGRSVGKSSERKIFVLSLLGWAYSSLQGHSFCSVLDDKSIYKYMIPNTGKPLYN